MLIISNTFIAKAHLKYDELGEVKNIPLLFLKETLGDDNRITYLDPSDLAIMVFRVK